MSAKTHAVGSNSNSELFIMQPYCYGQGRVFKYNSIRKAKI